MNIKKLSICTLLLGAAMGLIAATAGAVDQNGPGRVGNPGPQPTGPWTAEYKYVHPYTDLRGNHYTYAYAYVSGATQAYCEQQIPPNVIVVQFCTQ